MDCGCRKRFMLSPQSFSEVFTVDFRCRDHLQYRKFDYVSLLYGQNFSFFRYYAVTAPIKYSQHRDNHFRAYIFIFLCWIASIAIGKFKNIDKIEKSCIISFFQEAQSCSGPITFRKPNRRPIRRLQIRPETETAAQIWMIRRKSLCVPFTTLTSSFTRLWGHFTFPVLLWSSSTPEFSR